jgi:Papain family cysteine protease/Cathepsin propeptide inhibitor domain (I29)
MEKLKFLFLLAFCSSLEANRRLSIPSKPRALNIRPEEQKSFFVWMREFSKNYSSSAAQDEAMRNFVVNKREIDAHNKLFSLGLVKFRRATWKCSDMSSSQKSEFLLGSRAPTALALSRDTTLNVRGSASVDWVKAGLVGPVAEQGWCGSCWAFAAAGVIEAALRRENITTPVSAQHMVDCSTANRGCVSGWPKTALDYLKTSGFTSEDKYVYDGVKEPCTYTPEMAIGRVNESFIVFANGETK